ncbi:hypothetical protein TU87_19825 [Pseudomonas weihenstephanensis]|nr:hypothetical protein TU87_19825 [Pseudomonas weihenstephanensis]
MRQRAWVGFERLGKHTEHMPHTHARLIGAQPDTRLLDELTRAGLEARSIGDCQHIGYIEGAISAGHKLTLSVQPPFSECNQFLFSNTYHYVTN